MPKPKKHSDDKLLMAVRKVLQSVEPRPLPTKTKVNEIFIDGRLWARHEGWECPICGEYCRRQDRTVRRRYGSEHVVDYSGYNMHFAHAHSEEFWKEKQVIKVVRAHLRSQIRTMTKKSDLYKLLKTELSALGWWKNRPRGKADVSHFMKNQ